MSTNIQGLKVKYWKCCILATCMVPQRPTCQVNFKKPHQWLQQWLSLWNNQVPSSYLRNRSIAYLSTGVCWDRLNFPRLPVLFRLRGGVVLERPLWEWTEDIFVPRISLDLSPESRARIRLSVSGSQLLMCIRITWRVCLQSIFSRYTLKILVTDADTFAGGGPIPPSNALTLSSDLILVKFNLIPTLSTQR